MQELQEKNAQGAYEGCPLHFIGHLQKNKAKFLVGTAELIHSVDSLRLAEEISAQSVKHEVTTYILIEVNIAGEETKFGTDREEAIALVEAAAKTSEYPHLWSDDDCAVCRKFGR